jgi:beta-glucanase (GH16 family)
LINNKKHLVVLASFCLALVGCDTEQSAPVAAVEPEQTDFVWAVNVGGPEYTGIEGTEYVAEESVSGGEVGHMETVKGSQDEFLYQGYREGDIEIARPLANGTYDITFHFAEPAQYGPGDRVFDVFAEGQRVIDDLDVLVFRDGKIESALTVTAPNVEIADGELNIAFDASAGEPLLSALVVRGNIPPRPEWELLWSDEFDYEGRPDPDLWYIENWPPLVANSEDQAYTTRSRNVRVADGLLTIEAHKEEYAGARYTSARIRSVGEGDVHYGRVEVRARLPGGVGTWAAIWMLPRDPYFYATNCGPGDDIHGTASCNAWPNSGEIDIMEYVGFQKNHIHGTVHNEAHYFIKWNQHKGRILVDGVEDEFHVYSLEWSPEKIDIFVDDSLYFSYMNEQLGWQAWPYDKPFYVILNLAVGGDWGRAGGPIDDDIFPQQMLVDYVRVYQLESEDG